MKYTYFFTSSRKEYKIIMGGQYMIPRTEKGVEYDVLHTSWKYYIDNTAGYMKISTWEHPFKPIYYAVYSVEGFPSTVQQ